MDAQAVLKLSVPCTFSIWNRQLTNYYKMITKLQLHATAIFFKYNYTVLQYNYFMFIMLSTYFPNEWKCTHCSGHDFNNPHTLSVRTSCSTWYQFKWTTCTTQQGRTTTARSWFYNERDKQILRYPSEFCQTKNGNKCDGLWYCCACTAYKKLQYYTMGIPIHVRLLPTNKIAAGSVVLFC